MNIENLIGAMLRPKQRGAYAAVFLCLVFQGFATEASAIQIFCAKSWKPESGRVVGTQVDAVLTELRVDQRTANLLRDSTRRWDAGTPTQCVELTVSGRIENGDARRLADMLKAEPLVTRMNLISTGGDVDEAIEMARIIRKNLIQVSVPGIKSCSKAAIEEERRRKSILPPSSRLFLCDQKSVLNTVKAAPCVTANMASSECVCASACVIVLAGAVARNIIGDWFRDVRYEASLPTSDEISFSNIGIHRPSAAWFRSAAQTDVMAVMQRVRGAISQAFTEFEIPGEMLDLMYQTTSDKIRYLTDKEVKRMLPELTPSWEEKTIQVCGATFDDLHRAQLALVTANQTVGKPYRQIDAQMTCIFALRMAESLAQR